MAIQVFVNLEDLISWILFGILMAILLLGWIVVGIINGIGALFFGEKKREKMYEEYERKYGGDADDGSEDSGDS